MYQRKTSNLRRLGLSFTKRLPHFFQTLLFLPATEPLVMAAGLTIFIPPSPPLPFKPSSPPTNSFLQTGYLWQIYNSHLAPGLSVLFKHVLNSPTLLKVSVTNRNYTVTDMLIWNTFSFSSGQLNVLLL
jgi:hypothetical protein